uniref:Lipoprotein n=1 Tax=Streptomyces sp. NBC_00049 TaxID=2903617 RepID=A0AAU2JIE3_9ACTN
MQLRRALPLTLAALALATGCVTVQPAARPDVHVPRPESPQPTTVALPLGSLPGAAEPMAVPSAPPVPPVEAPAPAVAPAGPPAPPRPRRPYRPHRVKPAKPAARPAAPAKPRKHREPAPAKPRPAPRHPYDMAQLCEAARGTVSPSIVALCR